MRHKVLGAGEGVTLKQPLPQEACSLVGGGQRNREAAALRVGWEGDGCWRRSCGNTAGVYSYWLVEREEGTEEGNSKPSPRPVLSCS